MDTPVRENKERLSITIPASLKAKIEERIPARQRSRFAAEALEAALAEKGRQEALAALDNLPRCPTKGEDSVEVLRRYRQEFSDHHNPNKKDP